MAGKIRVLSFDVAEADIAYETDHLKDAELFVDEYNRAAAESSVGVAAFIDRYGIMAKVQQKRRPAKKREPTAVSKRKSRRKQPVASRAR